MSDEAIKLIRERLVPMFKEDFANVQMEDGISEVFNMPVRGYVNIDSYKIKTIQSDVLRVFTQPSYKNIGVFMGTWATPKSAMRFIDYKGGILVIPTNQEFPVEFWCGGKYLEKFSKESPILSKPLAGNAALIALLEDHRAMLVVFVSPRKELYLKNLLIGDENNLIVCNEIGTTIVPRKGWAEFKKAYQQLDKKSKSEALVVLRGINQGRMNQTEDRVQDFYTKNMEFAKTCASLLPKNPNARNVWLSAIGGI